MKSITVSLFLILALFSRFISFRLRFSGVFSEP